MIKVRFPNGKVLQYNTANFLQHGSAEYILREKEGGPHVAFIQASAGAVVEFQEPCRVYNDLQENILRQLEKDIRSLKRQIAKKREQK